MRYQSSVLLGERFAKLLRSIHWWDAVWFRNVDLHCRFRSTPKHGLANLEHLINHKLRLFTYLKQMDVDVNRRDLHPFRGK